MKKYWHFFLNFRHPFIIPRYLLFLKIHWTFPYVVYWVSSVAQTRQDIEENKKRFSASLKGVDNLALPVKGLVFKILIFILSQTRHFCIVLKIKPCLIIFMFDLCVINGTQ